MSKVTRIAIGMPWYAGPDTDTYLKYFESLFFFGRLEERALWFEQMAKLECEAGITKGGIGLTLEPLSPQDPSVELTPEDGRFEFNLLTASRISLPGLARERLVEGALQMGVDYLFTWDADMMFDWTVFLRLLRHRKMVVNAAAVTSRRPQVPCIYRIREGFDPISNMRTMDSEIVWDFPLGQLISDEDVGGSIAFGAGVMLYHMNVFREIPKPWFNSTGCGEDWFFCCRCHEHGVPRYVDTSLDVKHKAHEAQWHDLGTYFAERAAHPEVYEKLIKREVEP